MQKAMIGSIFLMGLGAGLVPSSLLAETMPPLVISGGPIYTGNSKTPRAEIVVIQDGRFTYVGRKNGYVVKGPVDRLDLKGAALFPGFTDAHAHLAGIGNREVTLNLQGQASLKAVLEQTKIWAKDNPEGPLIGRGWLETHWPEKRTPTRQDLDQISTDRPVLLERVDGHAWVVNSKALELAGIGRKTPAPAGGAIETDGAGEPTGLLIDRAEDLIAPLFPQPSKARLTEMLQAGLRVYAAKGWVGLHNMSVSWAEVEALEDLDARGQVGLSVYNAVVPEAAETLFARGGFSTPDGRVTTRAIKLYADGALGSRGAALFKPYHDAPGQMGLVLLDLEKTLPLLRRAKAQGIQMAIHAIGDRGNDLVLKAYEQVLDARSDQQARWRIEHAQLVRPSDVTRFRRLNLIASMQPSHAIGDLYFAPARLGYARLDEAYSWKRFLKAGVVVAGGSDAPVELGDPVIEFYAAVVRKDVLGKAGKGWHREERLSRTEALKLFTTYPAYARFSETERGQIKVGYRADLTGFSLDLMTAKEQDLLRARAVLTLVEGRILHNQLKP